jgi:hypothetical protein
LFVDIAGLESHLARLLETLHRTEAELHVRFSSVEKKVTRRVGAMMEESKLAAVMWVKPYWLLVRGAAELVFSALRGVLGRAWLLQHRRDACSQAFTRTSAKIHARVLIVRHVYVWWQVAALAAAGLWTYVRYRQLVKSHVL